MKKTKQLATASIFTALSIVAMLIGSIFETMELSAAAIGSFIILIILMEMGKGWALGVFASASVLALILLPNKAVALYYIFFAGYYPVLKIFLNNIKPILFSRLVRILYINVVLTSLIFVVKTFFVYVEEFKGFTFVLYVMCNLAFLLYDYTLERISIIYPTKIRLRIFGRR